MAVYEVWLILFSSALLFHIFRYVSVDDSDLYWLWRSQTYP